MQRKEREKIAEELAAALRGRLIPLSMKELKKKGYGRIWLLKDDDLLRWMVDRLQKGGGASAVPPGGEDQPGSESERKLETLRRQYQKLLEEKSDLEREKTKLEEELRSVQRDLDELRRALKVRKEAQRKEAQRKEAERKKAQRGGKQSSRVEAGRTETGGSDRSLRRKGNAGEAGGAMPEKARRPGDGSDLEALQQRLRGLEREKSLWATEKRAMKKEIEALKGKPDTDLSPPPQKKGKSKVKKITFFGFGVETTEKEKPVEEGKKESHAEAETDGEAFPGRSWLKAAEGGRN
jgi:hypothetical protein